MTNYLYFYSHKPKQNGTEIYSQWYPCNFSENNNKYTSTEQYMMANKALLFNDKEIYEKIMKNKNPSTIKELGRSIKNFDADKWLENRENIVFNGNLLKFSLNPHLSTKLLSTYPFILVEASPYDKIWGIGLSESQAVKMDPNKWPGENLLGKALVKVRNQLLSQKN